MPTIDLTKEECQQLINMLINANPLIVKIMQQIQNQVADGKSNGEAIQPDRSPPR